MIFENNFGITSVMPVIYEKKEIPVTMKITESTKLILEKICKRQDRPLSYVTRELMLRGLALYESDGNLREITDERPHHLAPVAGHISSPLAEQRLIDAEQIDSIQRQLDGRPLAPQAKKGIPLGGKPERRSKTG